jgi:hypothetical protein
MITLTLLVTLIPSIYIPSGVKAQSTPALVMNVSSGYVGDYVTVTGSGFEPDKYVTFMWGDELFSSLGFISGMQRFQRPSYDKPGEVWTDALGNFIIQLQVPKLTAGTYTIRADDTMNAATAEFTINPKIMLRNQYAYKKHGMSATPSQTASNLYYFGLFLTEGFVGDMLALQLSGFGENDIVEVRIGDKKIGEYTVGSGNQKGYGVWTGTKRVPEMPGGDYTVNATGKITGITALASFKVKPELFLASSPPSAPTLSQFPWMYSFGSFGLSWYSSVNATADSMFTFEATGLAGSGISGVTVQYDDVSPIACTLAGTTTIADGSTQGINSSTVPFVGGSAFSSGLSPQATVPSTIPSGKMVSVTIVTTGTGGGSFTFDNQLFSSSVGESYMDGSLRWIEGESTIQSNGMSLIGEPDEVNQIIETGANISWVVWPTAFYPTGSTVEKIDYDSLDVHSLTPYDQSSAPLSYYDSDDDGIWGSTEPVYLDNDNSGNVTTGDRRITLQVISGAEYMPMTTVGVGAPDLDRPLVKFPPETRPSYYVTYLGYTRVYLDKYRSGYVSEGDIRISNVLYEIWWFWIYYPDANGFVAFTLTVPSIHGGGHVYDVSLWNYNPDVKAGNTVTMQIEPYMEVTWAPTSYQSTNLVTEGSGIYIGGEGFCANEALTISAGGEYLATVTPDTYGSFDDVWIYLPAMAGGEQPITATGTLTADNTAFAEVMVTPALSVSPTTGYNLNPVTSIMVTGMGFEAGEYQIVFDGAGIGEPVTSPFTVEATGDEAGRINIAFDLPEGVEGVHIVDVVKTSDPSHSAFYGSGYFYTDADTRPNAPFPTNPEFPAVLLYPSLLSSPASTTVGTMATVTGKGLRPDTTYYVWYDPRGTSTSQAVLMSTTADVSTNAKGTLTASFQIPPSCGGTKYIWVSKSPTYIDDDLVSGGTVCTSVSIATAIALSEYSGTIGATISVSFSGLGSGTQYQLWWYRPDEPKWGGEIPSTALLLATATGALYGNSTTAVTFNVPATAELGTTYAVDLSSYSTSRSTVLINPVFFTVGKISTTITLGLLPATVTVGESVTINGVIEPTLSIDVTVFIKDPEGKTTNKTITSTSSGTFTDSFKPDKAGTWQVTATWSGNSVYAEYSSLAAAVTVKPADMTGPFMLTGLGIGAVALIAGLVITWYIIRKKQPAPPA